MKRRQFLEMASASALALAFPWTRGEAASRVPSATDWQELASRLTGRLLQPRLLEDPPRNPFFLEEHPAGTQSRGWMGAWKATPQAYAVAAESAHDVAAAVDFAREHSLRPVVKGTGHDYLGRWNDPEALLIWTHPMRETTFHEAFVPDGAPASFEPLAAVSVQAGTRWLEAYDEVTTRHGRYVQGGGCASVGACGGFVQGGGFGSFSKKFGTGAAGLLEAEVVTSDGRILVCNRWRHPDLFWALRGGGGGTFGVVTRMTLLTHPLPETFGQVTGTLRASSDEAFGELIGRFTRFYSDALNNEHWGEQFAFTPDNTVELAMTCQGLSREQVEGIWAPLADLDPQLEITVIPARQMWNLDYWKANHPTFVHPNPLGEGFWWAGNQGEVGMYWYTYQSRWIPSQLFGTAELARALFEASRHWRVGLHANKGLAGAAEEALHRCRQTSVNPVAYEAAALAILGAGTVDNPDPVEGARAKEKVDRAMAILRSLAPESGAYGNEADYFEPNWKEEFYGVQYPRLLAIKRRYDPLSMFRCHHGVGSDV